MKAKGILAVILICILAGSTVFMYTKYKNQIADNETMSVTVASLQSEIDAIGEIVTGYTVRATVFPGKEITVDDLQELGLLESTVTENYVLSKDKIVGKQYKVAVNPGTPLTMDLVMSENPDDIYERDVLLPYLPMGLKVGDYVDIRVVMPYGEEMIALERERIYAVAQDAIKIKLDEAELHIYTSVLKDLALYKDKGLSIYATKYIEPGINTDTIPYYPVRKEMEGFVLLDPNISNKKLAINSELRDIVEARLSTVTDEDAGSLSSGASQEAGDMDSANQAYLDMLESNGDYLNSTDLLNPTDAEGNTTSITDQDRLDAAGDELFIGEDVIE